MTGIVIWLLFIFSNHCLKCLGLPISDLTVLQSSDRKEIVSYYFYAGFSYNEILLFLLVYHGIEITLRQLHRILRKLGLFRRKHKANINDIVSEVQKQLESSSSSFGYRLMHQKLRKNKFTVDRETVRIIMKSLDPEGVTLRSGHKLRRRTYRSQGPNFIWHIDGYDKLKPFGFAIHGAIDGYSRKILWLRVLPSNNNPKIIGSLYLNYVMQSKVTPKIIRADRGSENTVVAGLQRYFLRSTDSGNSCFMFGSSTANQRIEAWWSIMRRSRMNWWINFFKDLRDEGHFDWSIGYHVDALRFCFMGLIQSELDETRTLWNSQRIRKVRHSECPSGRPDVLYYLPSNQGARKHGFNIDARDIELAKSFCQVPSKIGCSQEMLAFALLLMSENDLESPAVASEAKDLYLTIINELQHTTQ